MDASAFTGTRGAKRLLGVIIVAAAVFWLDIARLDALHQLWLPLALALGAYLITESRLAVLLATGLLAALHTEIDSPWWWEARAYPFIAAACAAVGLALAARQFGQRIRATHDERWAARRAREAADGEVDQ